jgi:hypothetical protein
MPDNYIELFTQAKDYLIERAEPLLMTYYCNIWDPLSKFVIFREMQKILKNEIKELVPDLPEHMRPQIRFRVWEEDSELGVAVQQYVNKERNLNYLGSAEIFPVTYDLYYTKSFDGSSNPLFVCKYSHLDEDRISGCRTAEAEYYLGAHTPLSVAYAVALDEGII